MDQITNQSVPNPLATKVEQTETEKLRIEMMGMMEQLREQNATLQAQLKIATLVTQIPRPLDAPIPYLPENLSVDQEVTYINHAGRPEHGKILDISAVTGTVVLQIFGKHENDVSQVADVKFGDKLTRGTFTLAAPPAKPTPSLPRHHPKGLQTPGNSA